LFAAENPINNNMKLHNILEARYHQSDKIELTQAPKIPNAQKKDFDRAVNDKWVDGVEYRRQNVYEMIYKSDLSGFLQKELFSELHEKYEIHSLDGQESYLGYVASEDTFVMGWDLWAEVKNEYYAWQDDDDEGEEEYYQEETIENMMMFTIECTEDGDCGPEDWHMVDIPAGRMYGPKPNGYKAIHELYPSIVDVRLD